jgi:hypothetical protein
MGCMVPQSFTAGGNRSYPKFWVVTGDPRYPGYLTPTKSIAQFFGDFDYVVSDYNLVLHVL